MSDVSLAKLSWEMMGAQDLIGMQELSTLQLEIESDKKNDKDKNSNAVHITFPKIKLTWNMKFWMNEY